MESKPANKGNGYDLESLRVWEPFSLDDSLVFYRFERWSPRGRITRYKRVIHLGFKDKKPFIMVRGELPDEYGEAIVKTPQSGLMYDIMQGILMEEEQTFDYKVNTRGLFNWADLC